MASGRVTVPHQQAGHMAAPTSSASPFKKPLPTGSRPHRAITGLAPSHRACPLLGGDLNWSTQHFIFNGKMECLVWDKFVVQV